MSKWNLFLECKDDSTYESLSIHDIYKMKTKKHDLN